MRTITAEDCAEVSHEGFDEGIVKTDDGDSDATPARDNGLFVIPRGRGDGFRATIRGHFLDLADPNAGHTLAPTPDDLLILSIASEYAWSARRFLRACGLPDDVSVSATWRTQEDPPRPADISLTITMSKRAEAMSAALVTAFETSLGGRTAGAPVVHISWHGRNR